MGRLDLLDVYRDEDYTPEDPSVDSPLNGAERQGTRSSSGATEEHLRHVVPAWIAEFRDRIEFPSDLAAFDECWRWTGVIAHGYGRLRVNGKNRYAHRLSHILFKGDIPAGLVVDHLCRNRACCNPHHLEAVTQAENQRRGIRSQLNREKVSRIRSELTPQIERLAEEFGATTRTIVLAAIGATYNYDAE